MKENILDCIGNTPLFHFNNTNIYAKLELFNPTGSVKDRAARQMILAAEEEGVLKKGSTIIEPTSGNTGIGLAAIGKELGYKVILTMPETMSEERRSLMKNYGAEFVLTEGSKGMKGSIEKAMELHHRIPNSFIPGQFSNPNNPKAHYLTTGPEIWKDMEEKVDIFVAGIGTGGTIMGVGKFLKERNPEVLLVGVEPANSPVLTKGYSGSHKIQGIGAGFIPEILDISILDEVISVTDEDAIACTKELLEKEGLFVGISSGAAWFAAKEIARQYPSKRIVVLFPDSGNRYESVK
ncbi:MAG: cysteine synthase A [Anaeroplasmataceae bacterium]|nr:cysteine synthase A [Anaeroplasmataceae bacterium]